jgi:hypothetical protein
MHADETVETLRFGEHCASVTNRASQAPHRSPHASPNRATVQAQRDARSPAPGRDGRGVGPRARERSADAPAPAGMNTETHPPQDVTSLADAIAAIDEASPPAARRRRHAPPPLPPEMQRTRAWLLIFRHLSDEAYVLALLSHLRCVS